MMAFKSLEKDDETMKDLGNGLLGLVLSALMGCVPVNEEHCWIADGDSTCRDIFGGGFCSSDLSRCEGHGVPYGCVFERPMTDECYSPTGSNASCAGPNPSPACTEVAEESGESGMSEVSATGTSDTSELSLCGDGEVDGDEECDDFNDLDSDGCTNACTLPDCGDGIVSTGVGEACDDDNALSGDLCTADCRLPGTVIWEFYDNLEDLGDDIGYEVEIDSLENIDILASHSSEYRVIQFDAIGAQKWSVATGPLSWPVPQPDLAVGASGELAIGGVTGTQGHVRRLESDSALTWPPYDMPSLNSGVLAVDVDALGTVVAAGYYDENYAVLFGYAAIGMMWINNEWPGQFGPIAVGEDGQIRAWHDTGALMLFGSTGASLASSGVQEGATSGRAMDLDGEGNAFVLTQSIAASYTLHKFDSLAVHLWSNLQVNIGAEEGAGGVAVLPNGGALVAGSVSVSGQPRGKLTWFWPDGQEMLSIVIEQQTEDLTARLYDVAASPDGYAVAVGSRKVGTNPATLWIRKFAI